MKRGLCLISIVLLIMIVIGCNSTPDYVIPPEKMARVLADIHIGESVAEINRSDYREDSLKKALKQSIYIKHGITAEDVDTSFVWYGHHIEEYIKVYDQVIEILEKDIKHIGTLADDVQITVAGDSADAWNGIRHYILSHESPNEYISFSINKDDNWDKGDRYQWQMKMFNNRSLLSWSLFADYEDGTTEYCNEIGKGEGWNEISLIADSTKVATRIYGVARVDLVPGERVFIDSISLIRTRLNPVGYHSRYNYKKFNYGK